MGIQISFSAAEKYLLSPMQYFLHYLLKLRPIERSVPLDFGNAVDVGLNHLLTEYSESNVLNLEISKLVFKSELEKSPISTPELIENGYIMLQAYHDQVLPRIKRILAVQEEISLKNESGDLFVGKVDLIAEMDDGRIYILDNKTSSKKYDSDSVKNSPQLATYFEALKDKYNLHGAGYIVIPKKFRKKKLPLCEIQILLDTVDEELIEQTFQNYDTVLSGIKNAKFDCTGKCKEAWWGCCYTRYCQTQGKDLTGLEFKEFKKK